MDAELEEKVAQWKAAKESKDWSTADALRAELRDAGFDPDKPRHSGQRSAKDPEIELKIHQWHIAKQSKDYDTADAIREELRSQGIEPDAPRGAGRSASTRQDSPFAGFMTPFMSPMASFLAPQSDWRPYDVSVENDLDQWLEAKQAKDYATADAIRSSLRDRGHSPSKERPLNGGIQDEMAQWSRAKKAKDFARSDRIRESLRAQGVDPEKSNGSLAASLLPPMWSQPISTPITVKRGSSNNKPKPSLSSMDSETIEELNQWFEAKEQKNYTVADAIRDTLRAKGVEPAHCQKPGSAGLDMTMEAELLEWFEARDTKDYDTADRIREGLRAKGVEPSQCQRPGGASTTYGSAGPASRGGSRSSPYSSGRGGAGSFDKATEGQLDLWWKHKQDKNYGLADTLRAELREQGIEPEQHRPRK